MAKNELDLQMEDYQYLPLRDVVFRTLRQAILRGELKPGDGDPAGKSAWRFTYADP